MKILFAFNRDLNPYVDVVLSGLAAAGCPAETGTEKFWNAELFDYDIVHIQWPETLFDWRVPSAIEMAFLRRRLKEVHSRAKIVFTRHNAISHHVNEGNMAVLKDLYALCEEECDAMVHLGEASRSACTALADKRHVMIPIPIYEQLYAPYLGTAREEARRRLSLPQNRKVVLAFGNFRYEKEKELVTAVCSGQTGKKICLIAPKWHKARDYSFSPQHPMLALRSVKKAVWAWRNGMRLGTNHIMSDEEVALHFVAADVVFIQRLDELNSGNVPMAFLFSRVVAGPDGGNIGEWLRTTGNPIFDAQSPDSVREALEEALRLAAAGQGEKNQAFAMANWTTKQIGEAHARLYKDLYAQG